MGQLRKLGLIVCVQGLALLSLFPGLAQRVSFRQYGQAEGLDNLGVRILLQTHDDSLWVGTENGLFRYDGVRFQPFGESCGIGQVIALKEDNAGRLWVGTTAGLFVGDAANEPTFRQVRYGTNRVRLPERDALAPLADGMLAVTEAGELLAFTPRGDEWVAENQVQALGLPKDFEEIRSVGLDQAGRLWLAAGDGLVTVTNGKLRSWRESQGVPKDDWERMLPDHDGGLWVRGTHHVLYLPRGGDRFLLRDGTGTADPTQLRYSSLAEDTAGRIFMPGKNDLLVWEKGDWRVLTGQQGFPDAVPVSVGSTRDGAIWIGLAGKGLLKTIGLGNVESWTTTDGLSSSLIWGLSQSPNGDIYVATHGGVNRMLPNAGHIETLTSPALRGRQAIMTLVTADRTLWAVQSPDQLVALAPGGKTASIHAPGRIWHLLRGPGQELWITTKAGLFSVTRRSGKIELLPIPGLPPGQPVYGALCRNAGDCYAAVPDRLFHLHQGVWTQVQANEHELFSRTMELVFDGGGDLWINGVFKGLAHLKLQGDQVVAVQHVERSPLASNSVTLLASDSRGWIWAGSDHGIDVFNGRHWSRFTQEDGLIWNDLDQYSFLSAQDGSVYIGTSNGLTHINDPERVLLHPAPGLRVTSMALGRENLPVDQALSYPWTRAPLTLHFATNSYLHEGAICYRYRLSGQDQDWVYTTSGQARYPQLPAGAYTFQVVAHDRYTHKDSSPITLQFTMTPPWWQTWWFYSAGTFALAGMAGSLWRWRHQSLLKRQRELEALVAERTRELHDRATHDGLTGLWNRSSLVETLGRELERARRAQSPLSLILLDFDHFKAINDTHGHLAGDQVLREAAQRLAQELRPYDTIGRYGGEEFVIVLPNCEAMDARARAEQLRRVIRSETFLVGTTELRVTCSFGLVNYSSPAETIETLLSKADAALYEAKHAGRDRVQTAFAMTPLPA